MLRSVGGPVGVAGGLNRSIVEWRRAGFKREAVFCGGMGGSGAGPPALQAALQRQAGWCIVWVESGV